MFSFDQKGSQVMDNKPQDSKTQEALSQIVKEFSK